MTQKRSKVDLIVLIVLIAGVAFVAYAWNLGRLTAKRDDLAVRLAQIEGDQTCKLAWFKARERGIDGGRTPSLTIPRIRVNGPPRVVECEMLAGGGELAEPLLVIERCRDIDLDCVDLR